MKKFTMLVLAVILLSGTVACKSKKEAEAPAPPAPPIEAEQPRKLVIDAQQENPFADFTSPNPMPPEAKYENVTNDFSNDNWKQLWDGAVWQRMNVFQAGKKVDAIVMVRFNPHITDMRIATGYSPGAKSKDDTVEGWRKSIEFGEERNIVIMNGSYFENDPWGLPATLFTINGKTPMRLKPISAQASEAMLICGPKNRRLPNMNLLDRKYDPPRVFNKPDYLWTMQSWPVLLDRMGGIRVRKDVEQANRSLLVQDRRNQIYAMATEGGFFTSYNLGQFLKSLQEKGLEIETAMSLDSGYEAQLLIETPKLTYFTYGYFEMKGKNMNSSLPIGTKTKIPTVIAFMPKK